MYMINEDPSKMAVEVFSLVYSNFITLVEQYDKGDVALRSNIDKQSIESVKELLFKLREELGSKVSKVFVDFTWVYPPQDKILTSPGTRVIVDRNRARVLLELYKHARKLGFRIAIMTLLQGPCVATSAHGYAIDEFLRVYKCAGLLHTERYFAKIDESGELQIEDFERYLKNYIAMIFGKKCFLTCRFGPLCYGGCKAFNLCPYELLEVFTEEIPKILASGS